MFKMAIVKGGSILLLVLACNAPAIHGDWLFDDDECIRDNRLIQSSDALANIWFSTQPANYYPITYTALWLQWQLWGPWPTGYHGVNLLLYFLVVLTMWRLLLDLKVPGAWTICVLFAVHPVNVETAAWMYQQKNTLSALFWFASLIAYFRFDNTRDNVWYAASLALFAMAMLSKAAVVTLPLALLACSWWRHGRISRADVVRSIPFFCLALILGLIASWFQTNRCINGMPVRDDGLLGRLASVGWVIWFYLYKAVWPVSLCFIYPRWEIDGRSLLAHMPGVALLLLAGVSWWHRCSWGHAVLAALAYFVAALVPVSGMVDISYMRYSLVADHWQYLALIAPLALLLGSGCYFVTRQSAAIQRAYAGLVAVAVLACAAKSWSEAHHYQDAPTLWTTVIRRNPQAWVAYNNLGHFCSQRKDYAAAEANFREALRLQNDPLIVSNLTLALISSNQYEAASEFLDQCFAANAAGDQPWYLKGYLHWHRHEDQQAVVALQEAIQRKPTAKAYEILGSALTRLGDPRRAETSFREALQLDDRSAAAHVGLARLCAAQRQFSSAAEHSRAALASAPRDVDALVMQANLLAEQGQQTEAVAHLRAACADQPEAAALQAALGERLVTIGRHEEALACLERALALDPHVAETHAVLGDLHAAQGRPAKAIEHFQKALSLAPHLVEARKSLGGLLAAQGSNQEAIAQYRAALAIRPQWPAVATGLAWLLATQSNPAPSDVTDALWWAQAACRETQMQHPVALDTLAAAYAADGQLDKAAETARLARDRARAIGQAAFAEEVQQRLDDYNARSARLSR